MTKNRNRHHEKQFEISNTRADWPSWFIGPNHPLEEEVLKRVLQSNIELRNIRFTVQIMQINYIVFKRNYEELVKLQREFDQPLNFRELALQTESGKESILSTTIEFTRLLHNYLASSKMLVDLTRRWVRQEIKETSFLEVYQEQITNRFAKNIQAQFLEDLRDFTLHRSLPLSRPELRFNVVNESTMKSSLGIVLFTDYLLEWDKWSELGRKQINAFTDGGVDIMLICDQYYENVTEFTKWLFWEVRKLFDPQVEQINSVITQLRNHVV